MTAADTEYAQLRLDILPQPDLTTCGPTCLHAVYRYFGDILPLDQVVLETPQLAEGGTLAVVLGCHALKRGYAATIYTFDLPVLDPTWFRDSQISLPEKLRRQLTVKFSPRLDVATHWYLEFLERGGTIRMHDLTNELVRRYLNRSIPILTGLSATYLYQESRECGARSVPDDIRGYPQGHFVVLYGYDRPRREILVADPLLPNPLHATQQYRVSMDRLKCAILLGVMTYDANLLIIQPSAERKGSRRAHSDRGR